MVNITDMPFASAVHTKTLFDLGICESGQKAWLPISGLALHSQDVKSGYVFAALQGVDNHGAHFAPKAIQQGAAAILTDRAGAQIIQEFGLNPEIPLIVDTDPHQTLARAAARWFAHQPNYIAAVTGTNGKTSVAGFAQQIWAHLGRNAASIGTLGIHGAYTADLNLTTGDPITLHRHCADMHKRGVDRAVIEASSHGLAQKRLDGLDVRAAVFTGMGRDHLDYHATEEAYFQAKARLFSDLLPLGAGGTAVVYWQGARARDISTVVAARGHKMITLATTPPPLSNHQHIHIHNKSAKGLQQRVEFSIQSKRYCVDLSLVGVFQPINVLLALAVVIDSGESIDDVCSVLPRLTAIQGRMQCIGKTHNGAYVFVDYAHTPDALEMALCSLRVHFGEHSAITLVFGAGGNRDTGKRSLMGQIAARYADRVIVTDDNPRFEDPAAIRQAILQGCPHAHTVFPRENAIFAAIEHAQNNDVILIAGKGHESGQNIKGVIYPFDDHAIAVQAIHTLSVSAQ